VTRLIAYNRNPNIGVVVRANDKIAILPTECPPSFAEAVAKTLGVEVTRTNVCGTSLAGTMIAMNNSGLVLPANVFDDEVKGLKSLDLNLGILEDKLTALGNLILLNDHGAIATPGFSKKSLKTMEDVLDCEVAEGRIAGFRTVGSIGIATNKGALIHPLSSEDELEWVGGILKVPVDVGTVNRGTGFVRTGIIANTKDVLIGNRTTGPEITRIEDSLGLL
jgi:translation initiation factor 6